MRRSGKIVRPVIRFIASVLIVTGVLMLVDAVLTVTWQEPVSAFFAQQEQDTLNKELKSEAPQVALDVKSLGPIHNDMARLRKLAELSRKRATTGHAIGVIRLPTLGRHYAVVEGTDTDSLRKGPGHYPATSFPGEGGTVAIAGHRTTYLAPFRTVNDLKPGDAIVLDMPYGKFTYAVDRTQIVPDTQTSVTKRVPGAEQLVLSACHPLYSATHRIIICARLRSATPG
jgi:sortase A